MLYLDAIQKNITAANPIINDIYGGTRNIWNYKDNIKFSLMSEGSTTHYITFNVGSNSKISTIFSGFEDAVWSNVNIIVNYASSSVNAESDNAAKYNETTRGIALFANE